ncbi:MAG: single-stranded DNA-binding protein [Clostridia bacterium]|nr:single-stranded DNA-binding protein [Clostridia bacterium]
MNYEQMENNKAMLSGRIVRDPVFSHEVMGEGFYETNIEVKRLSDQLDVLPVTISERLMHDYDIEEGSEVCLTGQFRSYNIADEGRSRLVLSFFVRDVLPLSDENPNVIEIQGYVCKEPIYRTTPFNREICDMLIAVNRAYNKSDYIPCIAWGRNARYARTLPVGSRVNINGRMQSRIYQKQTESGEIVQKTAYEVSVSRIVVVQEADYV